MVWEISRRAGGQQGSFISGVPEPPSSPSVCGLLQIPPIIFQHNLHIQIPSPQLMSYLKSCQTHPQFHAEKQPFQQTATQTSDPPPQTQKINYISEALHVSQRKPGIGTFTASLFHQGQTLSHKNVRQFMPHGVGIRDCSLSALFIRIIEALSSFPCPQGTLPSGEVLHFMCQTQSRYGNFPQIQSLKQQQCKHPAKLPGLTQRDYLGKEKTGSLHNLLG